MKRVLLMILMPLCCQSLLAAEVYRWTDEDGVTHFSDRPVEGAEVVTIDDPVTFQAPQVQRRTQRSDSESGDDAAEDEYSAVNIVQPAQDSVVVNTAGVVDVVVNTEPRLRRGHRLTLLLDGDEVATLSAGQTRTQLQSVPRGQHRLSVEVRGSNNALVSNGNAVSFTVQQISILNPNNPNAPPVPGPAGR